jgi:hypothetical protein
MTNLRWKAVRIVRAQETSKFGSGKLFFVFFNFSGFVSKKLGFFIYLGQKLRKIRIGLNI